MSAGVIGMLLGLSAAAGVLLAVSFAPPLRQVRLVDRLAPYVHDSPAPSRLLGTAPPPAPPRLPAPPPQPGRPPAARRVFGPVPADGARHVDRLLGGRVAVRRRLD